MSDSPPYTTAVSRPAPAAAPARPRALSDAAKRALAEAAERRAAREAEATAPARELNGRGGPDPVRYGDWEVGGIAVDF